MTRTHTTILVAFLLSGCGPTTYQEVKGSWRALADEPQIHTVEAVRLEFVGGDGPGPLVQNLQRCDGSSGKFKYDPNGYPYTKDYDVSQAAGLWQRIIFTNNTEHVIRLTEFRTRLFDPQGNEYTSSDYSGLENNIARLRDNCPLDRDGRAALRTIPLFTSQGEIVPGGSVNGYLAFNPASLNTPGVWKITIYGLPAQLDEAGKVVKLKNVEYRLNRTRIVETYERDNMLAPPVMLNRQEQTN